MRASPPPHCNGLRRSGRVWVVAGLPVLLAGVVIVLGPRVDHFALGLIVLLAALATAWLGDWMSSCRRPRSADPEPPARTRR